MRNGQTIHTDDYGFARVVDVDGDRTIEVEVQQTAERSFTALVWADECRPATERELVELRRDS